MAIRNNHAMGFVDAALGGLSDTRAAALFDLD